MFLESEDSIIHSSIMFILYFDTFRPLSYDYLIVFNIHMYIFCIVLQVTVISL